MFTSGRWWCNLFAGNPGFMLKRLRYFLKIWQNMCSQKSNDKWYNMLNVSHRALKKKIKLIWQLCWFKKLIETLLYPRINGNNNVCRHLFVYKISSSSDQSSGFVYGLTPIKATLTLSTNDVSVNPSIFYITVISPKLKNVNVYHPIK